MGKRPVFSIVVFVCYAHALAAPFLPFLLRAMEHSATRPSIASRLDRPAGVVIAAVGLFLAFIGLEVVESLLIWITQDPGRRVVAYMLSTLAGAFVWILLLRRVLNLQKAWRRLAIAVGIGGACASIGIHPLFLGSGLHGWVMTMMIGAGIGGAIVVVVVWVKEGFASSHEA